MEFNRHIEQYLYSWKESGTRKPLIVRGARQVGKTTVIRRFSKSYKHFISLNLEKQNERRYFNENNDVSVVIESLCLAKNISTDVLSETILFIDEIQESPEAIQMLRYFHEVYPQLHVIAAGSLLEFALKHVKSFPVGRVEFLYLFPLNFVEFLEAIGHQSALEQMDQFPVKDFANQTLYDLFNTYIIIGGMPEVVKSYIEKKSFSDLPKVYESIWGAYKNDVEKYTTNSTERNVIKHIMNVAHMYVDQRIKFQNFGNSNYRSREVGEAFRTLDDAKIVRLIYPTTDIERPLIPDLKKSPRLQFLDTGLINHALNIQTEMIGLNDLSNSYKGRILPHLITQEIISLNTMADTKPNFWVREKSQSSSEVDLVFTYQDKVIPIEVKSGATGRLKSLQQFIDRTDHYFAVRIYAGDFSIEKTKTGNGKQFLLMNLPYYAGTKIPEYIQYFIENHSL